MAIRQTRSERYPQKLTHESDIVWEIDIDDIDYVREGFATAGTRSRPVPWSDHNEGKRVGYAVLTDTAPANGPGRFERRVFFLKSHDRNEDPDGVYENMAPSEAVDPQTVAAGEPARLTKRAWGR